MRKSAPAADPAAYVAALDGWRRDCVILLRHAVLEAAGLDETIKWGHLVYTSDGPAMLIRAEDVRVLLGFWRGQRLMAIEPRLKPGGKYEMATLEIRAGMTIEPATVTHLAREAAALNRRLGDPTKAGAPTRRARATKSGASTS